MSEQIQPERLRELRDKALRYISSNGADKPKGQVAISDLKVHLGTTDAEYKSLYLLLHNHGLAKTDGRDAYIWLTDTGRDEASKLDHPPSERGSISINASYSIVQVSGHGSNQTAHLTVDQISEVLNEIERDAATLNMKAADRNYLSELIADLRGAIGKLSTAGIQAIGSAIAGMLDGVGSTLGKRLRDALGIGSAGEIPGK